METQNMSYNEMKSLVAELGLEVENNKKQTLIDAINKHFSTIEEQTEVIDVVIEKQKGRPVNPNSARQIRLRELAEKRANGELKRGRPVDMNSARQQKLANKAEGTGRRGRPVNPNSARQLRLAELEAKRANGEIKRGRPAGTGKKKVEQVQKELGKRFKVVLNNEGKQVNYSKSFSTPKSAIKEMKELGFTDYKLIEFAVAK